MTLEKMLYIAKNRFMTMFLFGLFISALSFLFLVVTQKNFKANSDILVVQNQQGFSDYYALSKSTDYLSGVLVESIYSEKFIDEMNNAGINSSQFLPSDKLERLKEWNKIVKVSKNSAFGIINIKVFASSQKEVLDISNAIVTVLTTKNDLFLGQGQNIEVRVLSGPIWEKNPSFQQIVAITAGGFAIGMLISFMCIYYREEMRSRRYLTQI